eukprot:SAG11_NODE_22134_length_411_cov_1.157051_1_plen_110_part_01
MQGAGGAVDEKDLMPLTANATARKLWVDKAVGLVVALHLDGLNFDFESPLNASDPRNRHYATIVSETRLALRAKVPAASVSVDVGWSPDNIDGRYYDYVGLAAAADFLYV